MLTHLYNPESLTTLFNAQINGQDDAENFRITFTGNFPDISAILILNYANISKSTTYSNEESVFGKAIRLLYHLNKKTGLLNFLLFNKISKVVVTMTKDPKVITKLNTVTFSTTDLNETINILEKTSVIPEALEVAITSLVLENGEKKPPIALTTQNNKQSSSFKNTNLTHNRTYHKPDIIFEIIPSIFMFGSQFLLAAVGLYGVYYFKDFPDSFLFWLCMIFGSVFSVITIAVLIGLYRKNK